MIIFTSSERAFLTEMRSLAIDRSGNEHLVGLNLDETEFYQEYVRARGRGEWRSDEDADRYLTLHETHEAFRFAIINAEVQLREEGPTKQ